MWFQYPELSLIDLGYEYDTPHLSYALYNTLVDGLTTQACNLQMTLPLILRQTDDTGILLAKISNFTRKVRNFILKHVNRQEKMLQRIYSSFVLI